jgi:NADPH:quinone reductase-like Zn-dependent oxidoreductase
VLIHSATGGVGIAVIQVAKMVGAEVRGQDFVIVLLL